MVDRPMRGGRPLVITDPTLMVRHANGRLVMVRDRKTIAAIPVADISHVAVHGPVTFTGAAIARILDAGLDVTLHTSSGRFRGTIHGRESKNVYLLLAQADAWNHPERRLAFARPLLLSKIAGQRQLLQRQALDRGSALCAEAVTRLAVLERKILREESIEALLGLEGAASAAYFAAFGDMLSGAWSFPGRVRRPPKDPVNALLSFGYTLAGSEIARHLTAAGFDPRIALLHGIRYGRESLPLDLVEEFRAPLVDRFTLRLLNRSELTEADFEDRDHDAVGLRDGARRRYLELWEEMLSARAPRLRNDGAISGDEDMAEAQELGRAVPAGQEVELGERVTWRFRMERQIHRLRRFLLKGVPYRPLQSTTKWKDSGEMPRNGGSQRDGEAGQGDEIVEDDGEV